MTPPTDGDVAPPLHEAPGTPAKIPARPDESASSAVLALDVGGSRIRAALVHSDGSLVLRGERPTEVDRGPAAMLDACEALLLGITSAAGRDGLAPVGLGISAPGPVDPQSGILVDPPNLGPAFRGVPLGPELGRRIGLPTWLARDTNVAALAESEFGAAVGVADFLYLTVSTGIGGAIFLDGRLVGGRGGMAGELGHMLVDLDGPECSCGARGHLEAISSGGAIARAAMAAVTRGEPTALAEAAKRAASLTARDVAQAEDRGDAVAAGIMNLARRAFAACVVGLVNVFAPSVIIVGGGVAMGQGDRLLKPAREAVARDAFEVARSGVRIVPATLGDDVGLIGSLPLVRRGRPLPGGVALARDGAGTGNDPATPPCRTANR